MPHYPTWDDLQEPDSPDQAAPVLHPDLVASSDADRTANLPIDLDADLDVDVDASAYAGDALRPPNNRDRARARAYRAPYETPKRKPASEREESFNALLWAVDGATGFIEELRHSDLGLSEEFWVHAAAAQREGLLTLRALIDQFIAATDNHTPNRDPATRPGQADNPGETDRPTQATPRPRRGGINVDF